jgi:hypothetical protein
MMKRVNYADLIMFVKIARVAVVAPAQARAGANPVVVSNLKANRLMDRWVQIRLKANARHHVLANRLVLKNPLALGPVMTILAIAATKHVAHALIRLGVPALKVQRPIKIAVLARKAARRIKPVARARKVTGHRATGLPIKTVARVRHGLPMVTLPNSKAGMCLKG